MEEYRNEVPWGDKRSLDEFYESIKEMIRKEIRKAPFNRMVVATVASTPLGDTCDVKIAGSDNIVSNVQIRANDTVSYGDEVYLLFPNNGNQYWIQTKK